MSCRLYRNGARAALVLLVLVAAANAQSGDGYDLTWNTIDSGGGMSGDGTYSVVGTIGQSDAGTLADGDYTLSGGFWAGIAAAAGCVGDCGQDGTVTVDELITGVNIALGALQLSACTAFDGNNDSLVTIDELIAAVNNALNGCRAT